MVVDARRRPLGRLPRTTTALPRFAALLTGRGVAEQLSHAVAVPAIGPIQTSETGAQVERQAPGAGHCVQIPVEGTAFFRPVEGQPGAPVQGLARPAQVQAGEAEEHQRQGAGGGDLLARLAHGQEAVQLQHQVEEGLAAGLGQQLTAVGVEEAHRPTALARLGGEEHPRSAVGLGINPQTADRLAGRSLDFANQLGRRQDARLTHLDPQHLGVEGGHDLAFEGVQRAGRAHQGQHQAGTDAEEPVQLKQNFLEHE